MSQPNRDSLSLSVKSSHFRICLKHNAELFFQLKLSVLVLALKAMKYLAPYFPLSSLFYFDAPLN